MILYLDTSALIKLYIDEPGSEVEVSESVAKLGGELTDRHPLRGFDAIHLASALLLKNKTRSDVSFSCFDERLKEAAQAEGLINEGQHRQGDAPGLETGRDYPMV